MDILFGIIIGVIVLTVLVVIHELGHALVAKKHGVVVEEFGVGFPPRAWSKTVPESFLGKNVTYSINWLPLGGFVKLQGENDSASKKGDYGSVTFWKKTQILLAGVVMNWITAAVLLSFLAAFGMPNILKDQFYVPADAQFVQQPVELVAVSNDLPASKAGLQVGDRILRFAGQPLEEPESLANLARSNAGRTVEVIYSRNNIEAKTEVELRADNSDKKDILALAPSQLELIRSSWSAPIVGVGLTAQMSWLTLQGLGDLLVNAGSGFIMQLSPNEDDRKEASDKLSSAGDGVAGPVGIFGVIFPAAGREGPTQVIMLAAIISLTLAVMNALPIPALDGGRWFVTALYKALRKPLSKVTEEKIHGTGFMVLIALVILITIADIGKLR